MKQWTGRFVLAAFAVVAMVAVAAAAGTHARNDSAVARLDAGSSNAAAPAGDQAKGRYKKQGNTCVWDANDSGPNQCTPQVTGRFKKQGNSCVWDASDRGPDQCAPAKGRWKKNGGTCVWDANDSGPNQCDPKQVK